MYDGDDIDLLMEENLDAEMDKMQIQTQTTDLRNFRLNLKRYLCNKSVPLIVTIWTKPKKVIIDYEDYEKMTRLFDSLGRDWQ